MKKLLITGLFSLPIFTGLQLIPAPGSSYPGITSAGTGTLLGTNGKIDLTQPNFCFDNGTTVCVTLSSTDMSFSTGSTSRFRIGNNGVTGINNIATAGLGVPATYAYARQVSQAAAIASLVTYTPTGSGGEFIVSGDVIVRTATTHSFTMTVNYNDFEGTARVVTMDFIKTGDATAALTPTIVNTNGTIQYVGIPVHILTNNAAITVSTVGTFTTVSYDASARISQLGS